MEIIQAETERGQAIVPKQSMIIQGDSREALRLLPDQLFQLCVTSPPYWGTRDYGVPGQIGAEEKVDDYVDTLVDIFTQVRRVLREDGILWLNLGDVYTSGDRDWRAPDKKHPVRAMNYRPPTPKGLKPKDLVGVPWRVAFALQKSGWFLRSDVIWEKPNAMPESVKDRPTRSHEYVFLLTKSEHYFYDYKAVAERTKNTTRNRRTVWKIRTAPSRSNHLAPFPLELVDLCVLSGSGGNQWILDPFFGSGTTGLACQSLNRRYVGIELHHVYAKRALETLWATTPEFCILTKGASYA